MITALQSWESIFLYHRPNLLLVSPFYDHAHIKGGLTRDFLLQVFSWISVPQAHEYSTRAVKNFVENLWRYSQINVYHRCQRRWLEAVHRCLWHRWLILGKDFKGFLVSLITATNIFPVTTTLVIRVWCSIDAPFHGRSNNTISCYVRLRRQ